VSWDRCAPGVFDQGQAPVPLLPCCIALPFPLLTLPLSHQPNPTQPSSTQPNPTQPNPTNPQQTLHWKPEDAASKVKDGDLVEDPKNFELKDGLLGTDFKYNRFKAAAGAEKKAAPSRHLLAGKRHATVEEEVLAVAGADGAVDYRRVLQQLLPDAVADGPVGRITA